MQCDCSLSVDVDQSRIASKVEPPKFDRWQALTKGGGTSGEDVLSETVSDSPHQRVPPPEGSRDYQFRGRLVV